jgi:3-dehydroquinate synthase
VKYTNITTSIPATPAFSYPIIIGPDLLEKPDLWLPKKLNFKKIIIITDHIVKKYYGNKLSNILNKYKILKKQNYAVFIFSFSAGEKSKNIMAKINLEEKMLKYHCSRDSLIIALGGGVTGDLAGFIAATYMRGIPYIQIPTTLLAIVDSSVGGKTSIDNCYGKNLIGSFWQPKAVIADTNCLDSLPTKQLNCGLIEALKMFLTSDFNSFKYLQKNIKLINKKTLENIITRAIKIKSTIVSQDEKENNLRMILNFGHTIGHAIEKISNYKILHGYAVGLGILLETKISVLLNILDPIDYLKIKAILAQLDIDYRLLAKFNINKIILATKTDKKSLSGKARYIILKNIGEIYTLSDRSGHIIAHPVSDIMIKKAYSEIMGEQRYDRQ